MCVVNETHFSRVDRWPVSFISNDDDIPSCIHTSRWSALKSNSDGGQCSKASSNLTGQGQAQQRKLGAPWQIFTACPAQSFIVSKTNSNATKDRHSIMLKSDIIWPTTCRSASWFTYHYKSPFLHMVNLVSSNKNRNFLQVCCPINMYTHAHKVSKTPAHWKLKQTRLEF